MKNGTRTIMMSAVSAAFERVGENSSVKRRRRHSYTDDDSGSEDYIGSRRRH